VAQPGGAAEPRVKAVLTGAQRAAIVIAQLDTNRASKVLKAMSESDVVAIMAAMASLPALDINDVKEILSDFTIQATALLQVGQGGIDVARKLLKERLGNSRAEEVLEQFGQAGDDHPLGFLQRLDVRQITSFISEEHPQTVAVILAHMPADPAAQVLAGMDESTRADIVRRIATMGRLAPDVIQHVASVLDQKAASLVRGGSITSQVGGLAPTVAILTQSDRATEKQILASLEESDPALAESIRNEMFVFDDIVALDDRTLQLVLRNVVPNDLAVALKSAGDQMRDKFTKNMSERASLDLLEEMELLGPVRVSQVEAAQSAVVKIVRDLEAAGEIVLSRGDDEYV
jgi:flagellar motor switch protein FliG